VEQRLDLARREPAWRADGCRLEHHATDLTGLERPGDSDVVAVARRLCQAVRRSVQRDSEATAAKHRAIGAQLQCVRGSSVVEAGCALEEEPHPAAHDAHDPYQAMIVSGLVGVGHGHEVDDLTHSGRSHESRDQNSAVGEVELLRRVSSLGR
jgi:hypothetical protein